MRYQQKSASQVKRPRIAPSIDNQKSTTPKSQQNQQQPGQVLLALLDKIEIPDALKRQENYLRKQLAKNTDIAPLLSDMSQFIAYIKDFTVSKKAPEQVPIAETPAISTSEIEKSEEDSAGLLSGIFKKRKNKEQTDEEITFPAKDEPIQEASPVREVEEQQVEQSVDTGFNIDVARDILIELIEFLNFPQEYTASVNLIKERLNACQQRNEVLACVEQLAELIKKLREQIEKERNDLGDFLKQLTNRLHDIDNDIQASAKINETSHSESEKVNTNVQKEVDSIESSVSEAIDLQLLKTAVQSRIVIIRDHMDKFIESEHQRHDESSQIIASLSDRIKNMEVETEQLKEQVKKKQEEASRDALTGVANRLAYNERIEAELARHKRYQSPLTLLIWDVDKFKSVNDTYGHAAGDKVLKVIAKLLSTNIRETDFIARFGGEEFVVLMPETQITEAKEVAEKLRQIIEKSEFHFREKRVVITASCGLAEIKHNESEEQLFQRADDALYKAKETGRNRCIVAN